MTRCSTDIADLESPEDNGFAGIVQRMLDRALSAKDLADSENREKSLATARNVAAIAAQLGARYSPERVKQGTFEVYHSTQKDALSRLAKFADSAPRKGLVLLGSVGTGKDHLLAGLLYSVARAGHSCCWQSGQDLFGGFRDRMEIETEEVAIQKLARPMVLAISDPIPPNGELSPWRAEILYRILDRRYRALRPTWITMNVRDPGQAEAMLGSQVWDRLLDDSLIVHCFWPSYRERKANTNG